MILYILEDLPIWKDWILVFLFSKYNHVCGQENWFWNWSTEYFFVNFLCTPTPLIARNILHEVRNKSF